MIDSIPRERWLEPIASTAVAIAMEVILLAHRDLKPHEMADMVNDSLRIFFLQFIPIF